jgi:hypothetical protein
MAPNFKKVRVFGQRRSFQPPVPLSTEDPDEAPQDLEAGSFLNEDQRNAAFKRDANTTHHQGDNPYVDEYRA